MQYLFYSGIILSAFLALVLFSKSGKTVSDYLLASWFIFSGGALFSFTLVYTQQYLTYPSLTVFGLTLPLASCPILFLYTKYQLRPIFSFNKKDLLHFIPLIIVSLIFINFYFLPYETRVDILKNRGSEFEVQDFIKLIAIYLSGLVYIPVTFIKLRNYKRNLNNEFSNIERINFNWLLYLLIGLGIIWIVILFLKDDRFIFGSVSIFIIWSGFFGINQVNVFNQNITRTTENLQSVAEISSVISNIVTVSTKYQNSALDENTITSIYKELVVLLDEKKPYTNPDLNLNELAKMLNVHPNHLSQVINSITNKSFYDLINERRIQEFLRCVILPENKKYTLLTLAFECGFNSKASFNRNFKKIVGKSPSDYLNSISQ
jgi:AraC-like DNA-binding protein